MRLGPSISHSSMRSGNEPCFPPLLMSTIIHGIYRAEEVKYESEVREEMAQLEALLATAKREYELLRITFEKTMAANDQAAPLAK